MADDRYEMEIHEGIGERGMSGLFFADVIHIDADGNRRSIGQTGQRSMKPDVEADARDMAKAHRKPPETKTIDFD
jgi:hypothetical protein